MTLPAHVSYPYLVIWIISKLFGFQLTLTQTLVLFVSSILPDLDYIIVWLKDRAKLALHHHEWPTHAPLYYLLVVAVIWWFSLEIGIVFLIGSMSHFVMDMFFTADGIRWLQPFSSREFYVDNPTRGKHGKEWLRAYRKLLIWKIDGLVSIVAICVFLFEHVFSK